MAALSTHYLIPGTGLAWLALLVLIVAMLVAVTAVVKAVRRP